MEVILEMLHNINKIKSELDTLPDYDNQIYLQGFYAGQNPTELTEGQTYKYVDENELACSVPLFDLPVINSIIDHYDLVRTRVMKMKPKTCYYWHKDVTKRLHIPVVTHEHCFLIVDGEQIHLPATGDDYIIDTTKMHTAMNCSKIDRIHIVGAFRV